MTSSMGGYTGLRGPTGKVGNKIPSGYKAGQLSNFTPEQSQLFQQMFSNVSPESYLSRLAGGDQSMFDEIEAPELRQFNELQGGISSRFSGMGMGARKSSGFQNTMTAASSNFAQDLASRRHKLQQDAIKSLMGLSGDLLGQRPYESFMTEKQPSFLDKWLGLAGRTMGAATKGAAMGGF